MDLTSLSKNPELPLDLDKNTIGRLTQFIEALFQQEDNSFATFTFPIDCHDPLAVLQKGWNSNTFQYYWEKPSESFAIAAGGALHKISAEGADRFEVVNKQRQTFIDTTSTFSASTHAYSGIIFVGGFSFFDHLSDPAWHSFEAGTLTVPEWLILQDDKYALTTLSFSLDHYSSDEDLLKAVLQRLQDVKQKISGTFSQTVMDAPQSSPQQSTIFRNGYQDWVNAVNHAKKEIQQKSFKKIVLARQTTVPRNSAAPPTEMLNRLRQQYQNCSCFLVHPGRGHSFLGATPEQLASFQHELLLTEALAGSIKRGKTVTEDATLANDLSISPKNRNEHQFVVADIEDRLAPFTQTIHHKKSPEIKKLSNVQHLYTPIRARLSEETDILPVLAQLHPTPAVGGYPWKKAAPYIRQLENFERGWYAGPVGWLNAKGSGEFSVAIRSGLIGPRKAHFFAGCGIVSDSDPEKEWQETNLKLTPMISALQYD
ncbi:isochorismate synthase [Fodinibius salsisoli]|uniref:isochorismate synthase n=1 Tax=Fodinibius salsisoli TaxID=2820877 RepID=A0ABT3PN80_9BACT|nr:isochorismate synthase [Fodinibius salsisoli]MCW9707382.1 isochorismate synthase [Fodinibius salsisoli]